MWKDTFKKRLCLVTLSLGVKPCGPLLFNMEILETDKIWLNDEQLIAKHGELFMEIKTFIHHNMTEILRDPKNAHLRRSTVEGAK